MYNLSTFTPISSATFLQPRMSHARYILINAWILDSFSVSGHGLSSNIYPHCLSIYGAMVDGLHSLKVQEDRIGMPTNCTWSWVVDYLVSEMSSTAKIWKINSRCSYEGVPELEHGEAQTWLSVSRGQRLVDSQLFSCLFIVILNLLIT